MGQKNWDLFLITFSSPIRLLCIVMLIAKFWDDYLFKQKFYRYLQEPWTWMLGSDILKVLKKVYFWGLLRISELYWTNSFSFVKKYQFCFSVCMFLNLNSNWNSEENSQNILWKSEIQRNNIDGISNHKCIIIFESEK